MRISDKTLSKLLTRQGALNPAKLTELTDGARRNGNSLQEQVLRERVFDEVDLTKMFAEYAGFDFVEIVPEDIPNEVLARLPERIARQYNAVVYQIDESGVAHFAMDDPDDVEAISFIQKELGANSQLHIATHTNILNCLELYRGDVDKELSQVIDVQREEDEANKEVSEADVAEDSPIAKTVDLLLEYAIRSQASDIHIEPREGYVQVRYRIDGVLKEVNQLPKNVLAALISRVKILSNLKIDERRVPQDGRFKVKVAGKQYALRVSTLPITDGEKVVMRILDESNKTITLEELGYWGYSLNVINQAITEPNGMILVTGPTGSGKSTSLFSVLSMLNRPEVNISTIEDPVEYKIPGVNQTQTNTKAGMTFASGLRALLRQDPNIIMVGEIRDKETANLGVQAALTGHLVFSTLHTNNAATCLPRLLDMGIEPFLIASTVKAVVGQRLVRRLCMECRVEYAPNEAEVNEFKQLFPTLGEEGFATIHELEKQAAEQGIGGHAEVNSTPSGINKLWRANPEGCNECHSSGYSGRVGIYEVLGNSVGVQKLITANATSTDIQDMAISEGMLTMQTDGLIKTLRGTTTLEEVLRVTRE
jgi:type IV pilus assembly protein PilB